jgi:hypothetical protein
MKKAKIKQASYTLSILDTYTDAKSQNDMKKAKIK